MKSNVAAAVTFTDGTVVLTIDVPAAWARKPLPITMAINETPLINALRAVGRLDNNQIPLSRALPASLES